MPYQRHITATYLLVWIGLCIFAGSILYLLYSTDYESELTTIKLAEKNIVKQARDNIESNLSYVISDLRYLANHSSLGSYLDYPTEQTLQGLNQAFSSKLQVLEGNYLQLRYISLDGQEIARVDTHGGQINVATHDELQNKSDRYYFKQILELKSSNDIYLSPIDLNVEQGNIVVPHQPVIRFAMKIFRDGVPRGILILNYNIKKLLDSPEIFNSKLWLVNHNGYWLAGPEDELEWGFMYPDRNNTRFQDTYPDVWQQTAANTVEHQELFKPGLFTYDSISLSALGNTNESKNNSRVLHIFSSVSKAEIDQALTEVKTRYLILLISSILIVSVSAYFLYRSSRLTEKSEDIARHSKLKFEQLIEHAPDAMVVCRPDGSIVLVNKQTEQLFGYSRKEIIGKQVDILIPGHIREQHAGHFKSYVKAPTARPMGSRNSDLKGLRKDGTEFPVSISLSPIDSGEDMLIVSAIRNTGLE